MADFEQRLLSLARVHELLAQGSWAAASLDEVMQTSLTAFDLARFTIERCEHSIDPTLAASLTMTLHELATNASKHGALSVDTGRIDIACSVHSTAKAQGIEIVWSERGGPPVTEPQHQGFGLRLIRRVLAGEKDASVTLDFEPSGLICRLVFPLRGHALS